MKKLILITAMTGILYGCGGGGTETENVVITNRGSASLTIIDAQTDAVKRTVNIPGSEPMYVVHVPKTQRLYVGDRAQNKVHVLHPSTFEIEASIDVGRGVFHMWADGQGDQLWVANDVDNTLSVIQLSDRSVRTVALQDKPHDVFLTADGRTAYVSVLVPNAPDKVLQFNAQTLALQAQTDVGEDPHLYFVEQGQKLYVANQEGGLNVFQRNLQPDFSLNLAGAHGIFASRSGAHVFMTNISGRQLYSLNTQTKALTQAPLDLNVNTPHNLVVNGNDKKLFVTHSGATANQVTVYNIDAQGQLTFSKPVTAGTNPFGIAYYRYW